MTNWILDPGHGGIAFGQYMTKGKRSPEVPPGIYEGEFNREVCQWISAMYLSVTPAHRERDPIFTVVGALNVPLAYRVSFVNELQRRVKDCALISVHANAAPGKGWSDPRGFTVFTDRTNDQDSYNLAHLIEKELTALGYTDSRGVRQANHAMTFKTTCPAVLVECGFMTNKEEAKHLATPNAQHAIGGAIARAMIKYEGLDQRRLTDLS